MSKLTNKLYYEKYLAYNFTKVDDTIENLKIEVFNNNDIIKIVSDNIRIIDTKGLAKIDYISVLEDKLSKNTNLSSKFVEDIIYSTYAKNNLEHNLSQSLMYATSHGGLYRYGVEDKIDVDTLLSTYAKAKLDSMYNNNEKLLNILKEIIIDNKPLDEISNLDIKNDKTYKKELDRLLAKHSFIVAYIKSQTDILDYPNCASLWDSLMFKKKISNLNSFRYIKDDKIDFTGVEITPQIEDMVNEDIRVVKNAFNNHYVEDNRYNDDNFHIAYRLYPDSFVKLHNRFRLFDTSNLENVFFNAKVEILNDVLESISYLPVKNYLIDNDGIPSKVYEILLKYVKDFINDFIEYLLYIVYDIPYQKSLFNNKNTHTLKNLVSDSIYIKLVLEKDSKNLIKFIYDNLDMDNLVKNKTELFSKFNTVPKSEDKQELAKNYVNLVVNDLYSASGVLNILTHIYKTCDIDKIYLDDNLYNKLKGAKW